MSLHEPEIQKETSSSKRHGFYNLLLAAASITLLHFQESFFNLHDVAANQTKKLHMLFSQLPKRCLHNGIPVLSVGKFMVPPCRGLIGNDDPLGASTCQHRSRLGPRCRALWRARKHRMASEKSPTACFSHRGRCQIALSLGPACVPCTTSSSRLRPVHLRLTSFHVVKLWEVCFPAHWPRGLVDAFGSLHPFEVPQCCKLALVSVSCPLECCFQCCLEKTKNVECSWDA